MVSNIRLVPTAGVIAGAVALIAIGSAGTYVVMRVTRTNDGDRTIAAAKGAPSVPAAAATVTGAASPDVIVSLTDEAVARAGIEVTTVGSAGRLGSLKIPGTVQPNAYKSVVVTPLVGGRVTRLFVELGQRVRRGQVIAEIYSPELADVQTRYVSVRAELGAHEQELRRVEKLVELGAASRQELEKVHAEHTAATTTLESLRTRLRLLGVADEAVAALSSSAVTATVGIGAPIDGIVTARDANAGLNVEPTTPLATIVDLSVVWVVGALYERDFSAVRIGSPATVTTTAYRDLTIATKVTYIDPHVNPETRTAQVRVEVPNPSGALRLGMYAEIEMIGSASSTAIVVPKSALQIIGDRHVVYLVDPAVRGRFVEREVTVGATNGEMIEVLSGIRAGETIVSKGSFAVRAERERLGLRVGANVAAPKRNA